jgi:hypothetical protein
MSNESYQRGQRDARDGKGPANLWNAPASEREKYNAGYTREKENK